MSTCILRQYLIKERALPWQMFNLSIFVLNSDVLFLVGRIALQSLEGLKHDEDPLRPVRH